MNTASIIVDLSHQSPQDTAAILASQSYKVWGKHSSFIDGLDETIEQAIALLRPRALDGLSDKVGPIKLDLFQDRIGMDINDSWPRVLRGLAAKYLSDVVKSFPETIEDIGNCFAWLLETLSSNLVNSTSVIEGYGALLALDGLYWHAAFRKAADIEYIMPALSKFLLLASNPKSKINMRWRLAIWRAVFDFLDTLMAYEEKNLYGSDTGLMTLRTTWKPVTNNNDLIPALFSIFEFAAHSIPKQEDLKQATMFSGPGLFTGSGITVHDLTPCLKHATQLIRRIGTHDSEAKAIIMNQCDYVTPIRDVASYLNDMKPVAVELLILMGAGNPVSKLSTRSFLERLSSDDPVRVLRALKTLAHRQGLVNCDKIDELITEQNIVPILVNIMKKSHRLAEGTERIGPLKCQLDPMRNAKVLPSQMQWSTLLQSFAAFILGKLCYMQVKAVKSAIARDFCCLVDLATNGLKYGTEVERWAMSEFIKSVTLSKPVTNIQFAKDIDKTYIYASFKLFTIPPGSIEDFQWTFESWTNAAMIFTQLSRKILAADSESTLTEKEQFLIEIHQMGAIPMIFDLLKHIASIHGQSVTDSSSSMPSLAQPKSSVIENMQYRYDNDHTLSACVYQMFKLLLTLSQRDQQTRSVMLWENSLCLMEVYQSFASADVTHVIRQIFEELVLELQTEPPKLSKQQRLSRKVSLNALQYSLKQKLPSVEERWPAHLNQGKKMLANAMINFPGECYDAVEEKDMEAIKQYVRENHDLIFLKICGNHQHCNNRESRPQQHRNSKRGDGMEWFCSKRCQVRAKKSIT